ncbi:probable E3 ubiquitin ligase complex SCF subunit sconB [Apis florea]|uniref:probable E3 ubiquitin ligase complex SCF subunit sconB n=1 Tax=Apis florea TaxID=7463 RepID=UPI0012FED71B|nr:probable E3 ubiquitin ligase complex SCF subunit sconB [Apis florea]
MEFFKSFLQTIGILEPTKVDFIFELPLEVSQLILRKLDAESLLCAAQVSRKWLQVCKSDKILKQTARRHKREIRRKMREQILGRDSPSRIESLRRIRELRKDIKYNVASTRFETAAVFGNRVRIPPPTNIKVSKSNSSNKKSRKCIRI